MGISFLRWCHIPAPDHSKQHPTAIFKVPRHNKWCNSFLCHQTKNRTQRTHIDCPIPQHREKVSVFGPKMSEQKASPRVVIIGSGIAALAAAQTLMVRFFKSNFFEFFSLFLNSTLFELDYSNSLVLFGNFECFSFFHRFLATWCCVVCHACSSNVKVLMIAGSWNSERDNVRRPQQDRWPHLY